MGCSNCKERSRLIQEALAAYRAGDMDTYWSKLQEVATSMGQDVKVLAAFLQTIKPLRWR